MPTFTPPTAEVVPPILPESRGLSRRLFRWYPVRPAGVNVFQLSDGSFVQSYPTAENDKTSIPYPWNPNDPSGPYSTVVNVDGSVTKVAHDVWIVQVFYGGHSYEVDDATAAALTAAGYGDNLT